MQQLNILLIEAGSSDGLLEKILNKHNYVVIKQAFEIDAIDSILASSHPDITIFKTQSPNENMLEYIRKINQSYSVPVVIFFRRPEYRNHKQCHSGRRECLKNWYQSLHFAKNQTPISTLASLPPILIHGQDIVTAIDTGRMITFFLSFNFDDDFY